MQPFDTWQQDPGFKKLGLSEKARVFMNFFDRDMSDDEFRGLPVEKQREIKTNFLHQNGVNLGAGAPEKESIDLAPVGRTLQQMGQVWPVAETAANLATSSYGIPLAGTVGLISTAGNLISGSNLDQSLSEGKRSIEKVVKDFIYEPQTKGGKEFTDTALFPMKGYEMAGRKVGEELEEAGYPNLGAAIHTGISSIPILGPVSPKLLKPLIRNIASTNAWRNLAIKEKGLVSIDVNDAIKSIMEGKTEITAAEIKRLGALDKRFFEAAVDKFVRGKKNPLIDDLLETIRLEKGGRAEFENRGKVGYWETGDDWIGESWKEDTGTPPGNVTPVGKLPTETMTGWKERGAQANRAAMEGGKMKAPIPLTPEDLGATVEPGAMGSWAGETKQASIRAQWNKEIQLANDAIFKASQNIGRPLTRDQASAVIRAQIPEPLASQIETVLESDGIIPLPQGIPKGSPLIRRGTEPLQATIPQALQFLGLPKIAKKAPLPGFAPAIIPEEAKPPLGEEIVAEAEPIVTPEVKAEIAKPAIKPEDKINGITREEAGIKIARGDATVLDDIREGVKTFGPMQMQDAIRNEVMKSVRTPEERTNASKLLPEIDAVLSGKETPAVTAPVEGKARPPEMDMLGAKHDLTEQQSGMVLQAFQSLKENATPEDLQKAYLKLALPSDIPTEVGLGKVAGIKGAREVLTDLRGMVNPTPPAEGRQAWEMTREEWKRKENEPRVKAIQDAIESGSKIVLATQYKATQLTKPDHIKVDSKGDVRIPSGNKWISLTDDQVESLAGQAGIKPTSFEDKIYHRAEVEKAISEGKPVPAEVLRDYPELRKEVPHEAKAKAETVLKEEGEKAQPSTKLDKLKAYRNTLNEQIEDTKYALKMDISFNVRRATQSALEVLQGKLKDLDVEISKEAPPVPQAVAKGVPIPKAAVEETPTGPVVSTDLTAKEIEEPKQRVSTRTPGNARDFRDWVKLTGGMNPNDPILKGELKDMVWKYRMVTHRGKQRRQRVLGAGFGWGFFSPKAESSDLRTRSAIEAGWLAPGSDENAFMAALENDLKIRWADQGEAIDKWIDKEVQSDIERKYGTSDPEELKRQGTLDEVSRADVERQSEEQVARDEGAVNEKPLTDEERARIAALTKEESQRLFSFNPEEFNEPAPREILEDKITALQTEAYNEAAKVAEPWSEKFLQHYEMEMKRRRKQIAAYEKQIEDLGKKAPPALKMDEEPREPESQDLFGKKVKEERGPRLPEGIKYAGEEGLAISRPNRGDTVWTTSGETGQLEALRYEGTTGQNFDGNTIEKWTWLTGPEKGQKDQGYGRTFYTPTKPSPDQALEIEEDIPFPKLSKKTIPIGGKR